MFCVNIGQGGIEKGDAEKVLSPHFHAVETPSCCPCLRISCRRNPRGDVGTRILGVVGQDRKEFEKVDLPSRDDHVSRRFFRNRLGGQFFLKPRNDIIQKPVLVNPQPQGKTSYGSEKISDHRKLVPLGLLEKNGRGFPFSQFRKDGGNLEFRVNRF